MFGLFTDILACFGFIFLSLVVIIAIGCLIVSAVDGSKQLKKKRRRAALERQYDQIARDRLEGRISEEEAKERVEILKWVKGR